MLTEKGKVHFYSVHTGMPYVQRLHGLAKSYKQKSLHGFIFFSHSRYHSEKSQPQVIICCACVLHAKVSIFFHFSSGRLLFGTHSAICHMCWRLSLCMVWFPWTFLFGTQVQTMWSQLYTIQLVIVG